MGYIAYLHFELFHWLSNVFGNNESNLRNILNIFCIVSFLPLPTTTLHTVLPFSFSSSVSVYSAVLHNWDKRLFTDLLHILLMCPSLPSKSVSHSFKTFWIIIDFISRTSQCLMKDCVFKLHKECARSFSIFGCQLWNEHEAPLHVQQGCSSAL